MPTEPPRDLGPMSPAGAPTHLTSPPPTAETSARALIERRLVMLGRLAEIGMEIAEAAGSRATAGEARPAKPAKGIADPALAYARAARAVRLTLALQSRLLEERAMLERGETCALAAEASRRRDRVHARVEEAIEAARGDGMEGEFPEFEEADDPERLSSAAWERLVETDDAELMARPFDEVVAVICRELGLPSPSDPVGSAPAVSEHLHETGPPALAQGGARRRRRRPVGIGAEDAAEDPPVAHGGADHLPGVAGQDFPLRTGRFGDGPLRLLPVGGGLNLNPIGARSR